MDESAAPTIWQWVSVTQASAMLKLSPATIRRRIRDGTLEAERIERPQGSQFSVKVPSALGEPPAEEPSATPPDASVEPDSELPIGSAIAAAVEPWVAQSAHLNDRLLELSERIGEVQARLRATEAERERLALRIAELERPSVESASRWRAWLGAFGLR